MAGVRVLSTNVNLFATDNLLFVIKSIVETNLVINLKPMNRAFVPFLSRNALALSIILILGVRFWVSTSVSISRACDATQELHCIANAFPSRLLSS